MRVRGRPLLPNVMVDDVPQVGGLSSLEMYRPNDFDRVEVYGGGQMIFAYTTYIESLARTHGRKHSPVLP